MQYSLTVPGHPYKESDDTASYEFVSTPQNERLIAEMIQSHFVGDFCVVGEKVKRILKSTWLCTTYVCIHRELAKVL